MVITMLTCNGPNVNGICIPVCIVLNGTSEFPGLITCMYIELFVVVVRIHSECGEDIDIESIALVS